MKSNTAKFGGFFLAFSGLVYLNRKLLDFEVEEKNKEKLYFQFVAQWLYKKNQGYEIADYFVEKRYRNIAIYGADIIGKLLYQSLQKNVQIKVRYFIDQNAERFESELNIPVYKRIENIGNERPVDVIVVTPFYYFGSIEKSLQEHTEGTEIVSIEKIISSL